jgi:hypothetical protein
VLSGGVIGPVLLVVGLTTTPASSNSAAAQPRKSHDDGDRSADFPGKRRSPTSDWSGGDTRWRCVTWRPDSFCSTRSHGDRQSIERRRDCPG